MKKQEICNEAYGKRGGVQSAGVRLAVFRRETRKVLRCESFTNFIPLAPRRGDVKESGRARLLPSHPTASR
jgi:hypothetical protein